MWVGLGVSLGGPGEISVIDGIYCRPIAMIFVPLVQWELLGRRKDVTSSPTKFYGLLLSAI